MGRQEEGRENKQNTAAAAQLPESDLGEGKGRGQESKGMRNVKEVKYSGPNDQLNWFPLAFF